MNTATTHQRPGRLPRLLEPLVILVIVAFCGLGILYVLEKEKLRESDRLQAIVDLQTHQVADWLRERTNDADFVRTSSNLSEFFRRWRQQGDDEARMRMTERLAYWRATGGFTAVMLHDPTGTPIWGTLSIHEMPHPVLTAALREAVRTREIQWTGLYRNQTGEFHLDYVVPLVETAGPPPLVVLHADPWDWLFPTLRAWPSRSASGESLLFRRDGDQVRYLCPLRHQTNAAPRLPVTDADLLAAQVLRGEALAAEAIEGVDYRGVPVLGVAQMIAGTDWLLIAKLDLAEVRAAAMPEILFIGLIGGLTLTTFLAGSRLLRQRRQLDLATATQEAQTERLNALEQLNESERRFQAIFEQAAVGIAKVALDGRWRRVNRRLCEILGYEASELLAKTFQDITHPDDLRDDLELMHRLLAGEIEHYALEKRYIRRDGHLICGYLTVSLVRTEDGRPDYFISVIKDISDRKAMESQLRLWGNVFAKAELNLAMGDAVQQRLLAVNPAFAQRRGYRPEEMADMPVAELFPADRLDEVLAQVRIADAAGHHLFETEHVCKDGERFPVQLDITVIQDDDGQRVTRIVHALDISTRVAAEAAQRESEERLRILIDHAPAALAMFDREMRYLAVSRRWLDDYGLIGRDILGHSHYEIFPEISENWQTIHQRGMAGEVIRAEEDPFERVDGHVQWLRWEVRPWRVADGTIGGIVIFTEDITASKQAEQELERHRRHLEELVAERTAELTAARAEAEQLARAKSEFLANMSHEIRTPMNAVLGLAYLLERMDLPDEAHELTRKIHLAGRSLLGIINDILDFSKIESGHVEIEHAPFRLDEVLDGLATIMTATAGDKPLELVIRPPDCLDCTLLGDSLRLGQILINLTSNAVKFTAAGSVEVRADLLERTDAEILIRFSVRDTGIGIDEATQVRLFQPFAQADASTTRRFGGSGLGLVISRRLVELMGGHLELDSHLGEGSTFRFDLRFEVLDTGSSHLAGTAQMRVLIVEDDPLVGEALVATVTALKWSATQVTSRHQALTKVLRDTTWQGADALVLLDHRPPELDGPAIATAIRQALPDSALPLLFLLNCARREPAPEPETSGAIGIDIALSKPLTPSSLHDAVMQVRRQRLGGQPLIDPRMKSERRLAGLRLLVVDDSDINRDVAQRIFSDEGAEVHLANDGREAVDWLIAHSEAVDIVLMDVQMPVMDGRAATRLIRETPSLPRLPIVALTADTVGDQQSAALEAGMDAFLSKPFDVTEAVTLILSLATPPAVPHVAPATASETTPTMAAVDPTRATEDAPARPESRTDQDLDLPGIALDQGLAIWPEPDLYRRYLRRFARDYADSAQAIADAEPETARQLAHKLKGTAGNMGLPEVAAQAGALEKQVAAGSAISVEALQEALTTALDSIARYAPDTASAGERLGHPQAARSDPIVRYGKTQ